MTNVPYPLDKELYQKNLDFWDSHDAHIAARLRRFSDVKGRLICPEGGEDSVQKPIDLLVGKKRYFNADAWSRAKKYYTKETHTRRYATPASLEDFFLGTELDPVYRKTFLHAFDDFTDQHKISRTNKPQRHETGQVTVFGLGLGCLLHHLIMETDTALIIILEESIEMVHHSLYVIDYTSLFEHMNERNGSVTIDIKEVSESSLEAVIDCVRHHKFSFAQNGQVIVNDPNVGSQDLVIRLMKKLLLTLATKGFFLDQIIMVRNFSNNVYRHKVPLLSSSEIYIPKLPCFIIGNGPSLEQSIDVLKKYREQAVFISCGTALGSLLARDIRPDIHVELENVAQIPKILRMVAEEYGLEDIHFMHTSTLDAAEPNLFSETTQFHRPGISNFLHPSHLFAKLPNSEPTVTNIGLALAGRFGFSDIYLFGVDMGTVNEEKFHASGNVYDNDKQLNKLGWNKNYGNPDLLPMEFAANFGGSGRSNDVMLFSRPRLEAAIKYTQKHYFCKVHNCSDGLRIEGAVPKLPHTLSLDINPIYRQDFMAYFTRARRNIDEIDEPVEHFEAILSPQRISESFDYYRQIIDQNIEKVDADTTLPLYKLFTALEEEFERPELTAQTRSRQFHNRIISGSFYLWSQKYVALDTIIPSHLRAEAAEVFIASLQDAFHEAERMLLDLAAEFEDIREERLKLC